MLNAAIMPLCSCKINHTFDLNHTALNLCKVESPVFETKYMQKTYTRYEYSTPPWLYFSISINVLIIIF